MYLSKQSIIKAFNILSNSTPKSLQGFSGLQYFIAIDRYYQNSDGQPCDSSQTNQRSEFTSYVEDVVSLDDNRYLSSFKLLFTGTKNIAGTVSSNFFNGSSVELSNNTEGQKFAYPKKGALLYALNGKVYKEVEYYPNLSDYLGKTVEKVALAVWLLRKSDGFENLTLNEFRKALGQLYSNSLVDILLPLDMPQWDSINKDIELECANDIAQINTIDLFPVDNPSKDNNKFEQKIYFGTPGSGKSWTIKLQYEMRKEGDKFVEDEEKKKRVIRTTFHPDTDYASFVGCYKPVKDKEDEKKIVYEFVPQAFTDAYVAAWSDLEHPYYLIIEEINRGNCAQIFGDLFQLLDRNKDGYSEYPIKADHDLKDYLVEHLPEDNEGIRDGKLCLPPNLSIIASMNTSDQSLFPMDSAFKRRWSWEYVPIDYENAESGEFEITIGGESYNWHKFLKAINEKIKAVTSSEDKQMGNFFIKNSVGEKEFCDKVMFYLWSEVGKDNYQTNDAIFRYYAEEDKLKEFSFNELYDQTKRTDILKGFIRYIEEEK